MLALGDVHRGAGKARGLAGVVEHGPAGGGDPAQGAVVRADRAIFHGVAAGSVGIHRAAHGGLGRRTVLRDEGRRRSGPCPPARPGAGRSASRQWSFHTRRPSPRERSQVPTPADSVATRRRSSLSWRARSSARRCARRSRTCHWRRRARSAASTAETSVAVPKGTLKQRDEARRREEPGRLGAGAPAAVARRGEQQHGQVRPRLLRGELGVQGGEVGVLQRLAGEDHRAGRGIDGLGQLAEVAARARREAGAAEGLGRQVSVAPRGGENQDGTIRRLGHRERASFDRLGLRKRACPSARRGKNAAARRRAGPGNRCASRGWIARGSRSAS